MYSTVTVTVTYCFVTAREMSFFLQRRPLTSCAALCQTALKRNNQAQDELKADVTLLAQFDEAVGLARRAVSERSATPTPSAAALADESQSEDEGQQTPTALAYTNASDSEDEPLTQLSDSEDDSDDDDMINSQFSDTSSASPGKGPFSTRIYPLAPSPHFQPTHACTHPPTSHHTRLIPHSFLFFF